MPSIIIINNCIYQDEYQRCKSERDLQQPPWEDTMNIQSDNIIYLDVVGGISKKKRIYGSGSKPTCHASSSFTSNKSCSQSKIEVMKYLVTSLFRQFTKQQSTINTQQTIINTILQRLDNSASGSQVVGRDHEEPLNEEDGDGNKDDEDMIEDDYDPFPPDV